MKNYVNIYTGKKVNNIFEALGYKYFCDDKKVYLKFNNEEMLFDFETNFEYSYKDLKFILCTSDNKEFDILFNVEIENNWDRRLRTTFADDWTYFKSAYTISLNEIVCFKYLENEFFIEIKEK